MLTNIIDEMTHGRTELLLEIENIILNICMKIKPHQENITPFPIIAETLGWNTNIGNKSEL